MVKGLNLTRPSIPIVLKGTLDNNAQKVRGATLIGVKQHEINCVSYFVIVKSRPFSQKGVSYHYPGDSGSLQHYM